MKKIITLALALMLCITGIFALTANADGKTDKSLDYASLNVAAGVNAEATKGTANNIANMFDNNANTRGDIIADGNEAELIFDIQSYNGGNGIKRTSYDVTKIVMNYARTHLAKEDATSNVEVTVWGGKTKTAMTEVKKFTITYETNKPTIELDAKGVRYIKLTFKLNNNSENIVKLFALEVYADIEYSSLKSLTPQDVKLLFERSPNSVSKVYTATDKTRLPYKLYVPVDYDPNKEYPLVLFFHGAGEAGSDNTHIYRGGSVFQRLLLIEEQEKNPCIILAPQCGNTGDGGKWVNSDWTPGTYDHTKFTKSPWMTAAEELLAEVISEYSVDEARLYVTGMSMGGFGTWDIISRNPEKFAAAVPVCGGVDESYLEALKGMPIRTYHDKRDPIVSSVGTIKASEILTGHGDFTYIEYNNGAHDAWSAAYSDKVLTDWLFAQVNPHVEAEPTPTPTPTPESTPTPTPESTPTPEVTPSVTPDASTPEDTESLKPEKDNTVLIIILVVAAAAVIGGGIAFFVVKKNKK